MVLAHSKLEDQSSTTPDNLALGLARSTAKEFASIIAIGQ